MANGSRCTVACLSTLHPHTWFRRRRSGVLVSGLKNKLHARRVAAIAGVAHGAISSVCR